LEGIGGFRRHVPDENIGEAAPRMITTTYGWERRGRGGEEGDRRQKKIEEGERQKRGGREEERRGGWWGWPGQRAYSCLARPGMMY
jgi:hypothetical protein